MSKQKNDDLRIRLSDIPVSPDKQHRDAPTYSSAPTFDLSQPVQVSAGNSAPNNSASTDSTGKKVKKFVKGTLSLTIKYFAAKLLVSAIISIVCFFVLTFLDVKWAFLWALLAGIGNFVPVFGQWIGMIGCIGGAWAMSGEWKIALYILGTLIILQVLDEFLFTPLLVGKATSVKPLLIIVILLLASSFLGFWGVLFAVPIAATVKLAYEIFWLGRKAKEDTEE